MMTLSSSEFARMRGISDRAARKAFSKGQYCGHPLPIVHDLSARGGNGGRALRLNVDASSPALLNLLGLPETVSSLPVERRIKTRSDERHLAIALDFKADRQLARVFDFIPQCHDRTQPGALRVDLGLRQVQWVLPLD